MIAKQDNISLILTEYVPIKYGIKRSMYMNNDKENHDITDQAGSFHILFYSVKP